MFLESLELGQQRDLEDVTKFVFQIMESPDQNTQEFFKKFRKHYLTPTDMGMYRTMVLKAGLVPFGALTEDVVEMFNMNQKQTTEFVPVSELSKARSRIRDLEEQYCREIWHLEDSMPMYVFLDTVVPVDEQNQEMVIRSARKLVEAKWRNRKELAIRVIAKSEGVAVKPSVMQASNEGLYNEVVLGERRLVAEIIAKISDVQNSKLKSILNNHVNGERRSRVSCLDRGDLAGVMRILERTFKYAPVTMMFLSLRDLFEAEVSGGPGKIIEWISSKIGLWTEFGFFDFLTPDMLFTFCAIYRLRGTTVGGRAFQEVISAMRRDPEAFCPEQLKEMKTMDAEMVLKQIVVNVIRDDATRSNFGGMNERQTKRASGFQRVPEGQKAPDIIQAHLAEGGEGEVVREEDQWAEIGGKKYPYTSTTVVCQMCVTDKPHHPQCFLSKCNKCGCYGHRAVSCKQKK